MSRKKHAKDKTEKSNAEDEKRSGQTPCEPLPPPTFDEYQCSGDVEIDFPGLCALLDIKDVPAVIAEQPSASASVSGRGDATDGRAQVAAASSWSKRCLRVELEDEDPLSATGLKVSGWRVDEPVVSVLLKMLSSMSQLQSLRFWKAGLTDHMVVSLVDAVSQCSNLRVVTLDGNPLPDQSYHCLLSKDSNLTHLSLRNNQIGDEGARLIGSALSTTTSSNRTLTSLNLAFNSIGDAGAAHIAQGLRLNRALLFLSLANNRIGDSGAAHLAEILGDFALTHDEVVERRRLLLERAQCSPRTVDSDHTPAADALPSVPSSTSLSVRKGSSKKKGFSVPVESQEAPKRAEKQAATKESLKSNKKSSDVKAPQTSKGGKPADKEKQMTALTASDTCIEVQSCTALNELQVESAGIGSPLLDQSLQCRDGRLFLPGNSTLASLNLTGNRITEKSLPLFLSPLETQGDVGGLLRLRLQRNYFPPECESHVKIKELMALRHKPDCEETAEEGQGEKS